MSCAKIEQILLQNHRRSPDAAASPMRFTMPSCKRPWQHQGTIDAANPLRLQRLNCKTPSYLQILAFNLILDAAIPMRSTDHALQKTIESQDIPDEK
jgi:hypothetical protein